jgi:hypothetical protein
LLLSLKCLVIQAHILFPSFTKKNVITTIRIVAATISMAFIAPARAPWAKVLLFSLSRSAAWSTNRLISCSVRFRGPSLSHWMSSWLPLLMSCPSRPNSLAT